MVELTRLAEDLGFDRAWVGDSQNIWREAYVTLGAIAQATERIGLGTGVTNAVTRHPSVLASAWATLSELAPGRVAIGVGTGDSSLRTMGMSPLPVAELEQRIGLLRQLLGGSAVSTDEDAGYRLHFANEPVPIYCAAAGRRALRLAGRRGDGVIACVGTDPRLVEGALAQVRAGLAESNRERTEFEVVLWTAIAIDDDGSKARDLVRAFTASVVVPPLSAGLDSDDEATIKRIRDGYDYEKHMESEAEHRRLVPDRLVEMFAVAGTPAECRTQIKALFELPVDEVALVPFPAPGADRGDLLHRLRHEVLDPIRNDSNAKRSDK
jgi:5,10-methylenetetrahydromethanopterin reductase